jgi:hypothetical protein
MISIARCRNWLSEMSSLFRASRIWRRPGSIVRFLRSGWVKVRLSVEVNCGLRMLKTFCVVDRSLD